MSAPVTAFVSYSHDSPAHVERVRELAARLRAEGIDVDLDQWVDSPSEGWPNWMERQLRGARFVLVVCTEGYNRAASGIEQTGRRRGVRWESFLTYQHLYDAGSQNDRFIPVFFCQEDEAEIPTPLRGASSYDLSSEEGYQRLYRRLTSQPGQPKPPLGEVRLFSTGSSAQAANREEARSPLPSPRTVTIAGYTSTSFREFLVKVLVGDTDLEAFCGDFFPKVKDMFGGEMTRTKKITLLLDHEDGAQILRALEEFCKDRYVRFQAALKKAS